MIIRQVFKERRLLIGGAVIALGAGVSAQLPEVFHSHADSLHWAGIILFALGTLLSAYTFLDLSFSDARFYNVWDQRLVNKALRSASPTSTVRALQTSFPNAAELVPLLKELLTSGEKQFKIHVLLANPYTAGGQSVIEARMRLRDQDFPDHLREIEGQLHQLVAMKRAVDDHWAESRDHAKLTLEIRLYDHLPFGPQFHVDDEIFVGFFVAKHSSVLAPMVRIRKSNDQVWKLFHDDFEAAWTGAVAYDPALGGQVAAHSAQP